VAGAGAALSLRRAARHPAAQGAGGDGRRPGGHGPDSRDLYQSVQAIRDRAGAAHGPDSPAHEEDRRAAGQVVSLAAGREQAMTDEIVVSEPEAPAKGPTFADLGLRAEVLRAVTDMGFLEPMKVQSATLPLVREGR